MLEIDSAGVAMRDWLPESGLASSREGIVMASQGVRDLPIPLYPAGFPMLLLC